jgi:O-antigen ligase
MAPPDSRRDGSPVLERICFFTLVTTVCLAPLPFGSVPAWAWSCLATMVGLLLVISNLSALKHDATLPVGLRITWPIIAGFGAVVAWIGLQMAPWLPQSWHHPLWKDAAAALDLPYYGSIAIDPSNAAAGLIRLTTYAGIFWLSMQFGRNPNNAKNAIAIIGASSTLYGLYALIAFYSRTNLILWFPKYAYPDDLTGTFVNRNNYATFAGLGTLCIFSILFRELELKIAGIKNTSEMRRATIIFIEAKGWTYLVCSVIVLAALLTTHSRGGLIATLAGIATFCVMLLIGPNRRSRMLREFGLASIALVAVLFIVGGRGVDVRLANTDAAHEERAAVYSLTGAAILDQPWLGTGYGSFEEIFRFYRTQDISATYIQAHDTYLELAMELGIPAAAILIFCVAYVAAKCVKGALVRQRDRAYPCLGVAATALVGTHALVDFSVQIPAVAATFAMIIGIGFAQSGSSRQGQWRPPERSL